MIEQVGRGGMARVWKAQQLSLDRPVAIKMLSRLAVANQEMLRHFRTETLALAKLNHGGIVQIYDAGELAGIPYCVMEYVSGPSVGDLLARQGRLAEAEALSIARGVALALGHAWSTARIIHCDIKPDNILMEGGVTVKVADLGLARILGRAEGADENILGTPNYCAPEQAEGQPDLDCRADIYALGAMLYHLVTGTLPFAGSKGSEAMDRQISDYLPDPLDVNEHLSQPVAWLIEKLMVKDRERRPATWDAVLGDLERVLDGAFPGEPLPDPGDSTVLRSARRAKPRPAVRLPAGPARKPLVVSRRALETVVPGATAPRADLGPALRAFVILAGLAGLVYGAIFLGLDPRAITSTAAALPPPSAPTLPPRTVAAGSQAEYERHAAAQRVSQADGPPRNAEAAADEAATSVTWDDPAFLEGAKSYNAALDLYGRYQKAKGTADALPSATLADAETKCRAALRIFEQARPRAPRDFDLNRHITDCYHLIADIRHSTLADGKAE